MKKLIAAATMVILAWTAIASAEVSEVRIAKQYGLGYLPLIIMEDQKLIEKQAKRGGLGDVKVTWATLGGGSATNDALLSGSVDYVASGVAPLVVLWAKTGGAVKGAASLDTTPLYLNTVNPKVRSIADFGDSDRIALPAVKVSIQAVVLQMAAAKAFGEENFGKLDRLTVSMKHPDAMAALLSGRSEITGHVASPPFMFQELDDKRVRTVLNSYDVLGGPHTFNVLSTTKAFWEKNPKTYAAVLAALDEADSYIRRNRKAAAETYIRLTGTKESLQDIVSQISRPEVAYATTPVNVHRFADFMYRTGSVKVRAKDWKELFFADIHHQKGS